MRIARLAGVIGASGVLLFSASGCNNALEGGVTGAGAGALAGLAIGSLSGNAGSGAAIGAIAGGLGGAVIGDQNERQSRRDIIYHDTYGRDRGPRYDGSHYHHHHHHHHHNDHRRSW